jgi:hypothetical protein
MNTCTDFFREYQRNDRAIGFAAPGADLEKLETAKERNQFLLAHAKASSSRDAARKVYLAVRLLNYAEEDDKPGMVEKTQSLLRAVAQRLRHDRWVLGDMRALRGAMAEVELIPSDYGCAPEGGGLVSDEKDKILMALDTALDFMCRPRLLH